MSTILGQIKHVVVVMFENRSLDNLCGWLYSAGPPPSVFLPPGSPATFDGLNTGIFNPSNKDYFTGGAPAVPVYITQGTTTTTVPNPDPEETFANVSQQICGPGGYTSGPPHPMQGFVVNYDDATSPGDAAQIMQAYSTGQVPVLSQLARNFAVSDAWFASVPSQTWPNRAFAHAGTSNGRVNNGEPPDPLQWNVPTIFNVLTRCNTSWAVYSDTILTPSLTRTMFPQLWDLHFAPQFRGFPDFEEACAKDALPAYSFIEPSFLLDPNDAHPPHDVEAAEQFLNRIWTAVSKSPGWNETLLVITFDEHGGCHDHVLPPAGAVAPDAASSPGDDGFAFDRFGIRVPTILVSPYIQAGTVFRSNTAVPYDHTSILATLRDWLSIPAADMLSSKRIAAAPTLDQVLTLPKPRSDLPDISPLNAATTVVSSAAPLNSLQRSIVSGAARRLTIDSAATLTAVQSRQQAMDFFKRHPTLAQR
jgi:phospholipase C